MMIDVATRILADAGRALSARKILQAGERDALFDAPVALADLRSALEAAAESGEGVRQVRRGVFALDDAPTPTVSASTPPSESPEPPPEKRRRRRRQKPRDLAGDAPATALTVEDAVAEAEATDDAATLRANLWKKMRKRAADVAGVDLADRPAEPDAPKADGLRGYIAQKLRARLQAEADAWVEPPKPAPLPRLIAATRLVADDATADLKARLAARWQASPLVAIAKPKSTRKTRRKPQKKPTVAPVEQAAPIEQAAPVTSAAPVEPAAPIEQAPVEPRRPRRQRRARVASAPAAEAPRRQRRTPARTQAPVDGGSLADQVNACLADVGAPLDHHVLAEKIGADDAGVRAAVRAANARAATSGRRVPFDIGLDGKVGLSQWSLSRRYRTLEDRIEAALREQRDLIREDLLARVSELSDSGFERIVRMLLDRMAFDDVQVAHREAGCVALIGRRDGEATAVVAHRTTEALDAEAVGAVRESLADLEAASGIVITTSGFTDAARDATRRTALRLVDGRGLARMLYSQGVGLVSHRPMMRYTDGAFFASLG